MMQPKHAWFSPMMAKSCGFSTFKTANGTEVNVTTAIDIDHPNPRLRDADTNPHSAWGDEGYIGVVTEFVSSNFKATIIEDLSKKAVKKTWKRKQKHNKQRQKQ